LETDEKIFRQYTGAALHHSPLKNPTNILELGTSNGRWADDVAKQYPEARVIGTDTCLFPPKW
jgi:methylase of polypeptide subunit release factors